MEIELVENVTLSKVKKIIEVLKEADVIKDTATELKAEKALTDHEGKLENERKVAEAELDQAKFHAWMYHWKHGARLFRNINQSYVLKLEEEGWGTEPKRAVKPKDPRK